MDTTRLKDRQKLFLQLSKVGLAIYGLGLILENFP